MKMRGFIDEPSYTDLHWVCPLLLNIMFGLHLTVYLLVGFVNFLLQFESNVFQG
jgi:hypothetical protein